MRPPRHLLIWDLGLTQGKGRNSLPVWVNREKGGCLGAWHWQGHLGVEKEAGHEVILANPQPEACS